VHGAMVSPEEIESVAASVRTQGTPRYVDGLGDQIAPPQVAVGSGAGWGQVG
jgi:DNA segregation ATPase FtsK/SpoIIIE-like protein